MINIKYDKDTHFLWIELFKRFIISINHGVPGDWFFFHNEDDFRITTPVGFVTATKDDGFRAVGFILFIVFVRIAWKKGGSYGR